MPYLERPEGSLPGVANWYASTCAGCPARCGALVKCLDGRPIKMEGNPDHPLSQGGLCARGQATILDLYDSRRLGGPMVAGSETDWDEADANIVSQLRAIEQRGGPIRILSPTLASPSVHRAIKHFIGAYPTARHIAYDAISASAILDAHLLTHGIRALPSYHFDRAQTIVSFDADFLGTWLSPVQFTKGWAANRKPAGEDGDLPWHVQFESRMSVTGANADLRIALPPSGQLPAALELARAVAERTEDDALGEHLPASAASGVDPKTISLTADELVANRGRSLVVGGTGDRDTQLAINAINQTLSNYGSTLDLGRASLQLQGNDDDMTELIAQMLDQEVAALILFGVNPVYDHVRGDDFRRGLSNVGLTVSLNPKADETASLCKYVCPDHHFLESWGDACPRTGVYSLFQPVVAPLRRTRSAVESLLAWSGMPSPSYEFVRRTWQQTLFTQQTEQRSVEEFWGNSLHRGFAVVEVEQHAAQPFNPRPLSGIRTPKPARSGEGFELDLYASNALFDGRQADNPWLQEMPDPVTKVTWGDCASLSPGSASRLGVDEGTVVEIVSESRSVRLPVLVQPGMPDGVVAAPLGHGRACEGQAAANYPVERMLPLDRELPISENLFPFLAEPVVAVRPTKEERPLAKTQTYDYQTVPYTEKSRRAARERTSGGPRKGRQPRWESHRGQPTLLPERTYEGHKWAMAIDLNACTGCSACVIACQAENNVPVVGKAEVRKGRDLHWLRIDRYYSGSAKSPDENPTLAFQPMLCQHCDHAPCEAVCPVLAAVHGSEGLSMQVYSRCIGTRYCANNCPYKVRRFNWFTYSRGDPVQNLVLNPGVTVRSRGVMEKCSFCAHRLQEVKERAKAEGRDLSDGEALPACAQSCPADAISFGDINDPMSEVSRRARGPRSYVVLGELGNKPAVTYLNRLRNRKHADT